MIDLRTKAQARLIDILGTRFGHVLRVGIVIAVGHCLVRCIDVGKSALFSPFSSGCFKQGFKVALTRDMKLRDGGLARAMYLKSFSIEQLSPVHSVPSSSISRKYTLRLQIDFRDRGRMSRALALLWLAKIEETLTVSNDQAASGFKLVTQTKPTKTLRKRFGPSVYVPQRGMRLAESDIMIPRSSLRLACSTDDHRLMRRCDFEGVGSGLVSPVLLYILDETKCCSRV
ncbi:hypothetical protein ARMGADRAFT_1075046 [Armillaria gallica]|uniref:Uncharacterized protein n=1 Tax=Armillaria gallica TaxID=47427 RepID=A0A2H3ECG6_ARMGA|nr:hypothetical protein ARMGADRAFT_1075046 [Armillaria gallica]